MAACVALPGAWRKEAGMSKASVSFCYALAVLAAMSAIMCVVMQCARSHSPTPLPVVVADTVTIYDTLTVVQPAPVAVAPLPDVVKRLPRWTPNANKTTQRDSALTASVDMRANTDTATDSVAVLVPMEQKVYTDSVNYRAVISGAWVALDTMEVYPRREIVTVRQPPDNRRWGVSLVAGYGWAGKWTPFVGVGVSYNLFRF